MSTVPASSIAAPSRSRGVPAWATWPTGVLAVLAILGVTSIWSSAQMLYALWVTDPLKSIGMMVPVVSFLLILRAWRSLNWEVDGSLWGFALLALTAGLVRLREATVMTLVLAPQWSIFFPPHSAVACAYGAGFVLLAGGKRLLRASVFPVLLLLLVNPVPHIFNVFVDLPLQRASAHVARAFAMALGQPLSPDKLRLMFTPDFGMFIAPGCNGIRGAVTMGFIALIAGYLYRFRWRAHLLVVAGAVLLGYVFNFVRLCVLVLYYLVALHFPALQDKAENADYVIGAALFFVAVYLLYVVIQHLGSRQAEQGILVLPRVSPEKSGATSVSYGYFVRAGCLGLLVVFGLFSVIEGMRQPTGSPEMRAEEEALGAFPATAGRFNLARRWNETSIGGGTLIYHWAEYTPVDGGPHVQVGISPFLRAHDVLVCHSARGEDPLWTGPVAYRMQGDSDVNFNSALFTDGTTQSLEASTLCNTDSCGETSAAALHVGFVYSRPNPGTLFRQNAARPIPILLKVETTDTTLPLQAARAQLSGALAQFLANVDLGSLTSPYRH